MSVSHLTVAELLITLAGFVTFYTVLLVVEMTLMVKAIGKGPYLDVPETEAWEAQRQSRLRAQGADASSGGLAAAPAE